VDREVLIDTRNLRRRLQPHCDQEERPVETFELVIDIVPVRAQLATSDCSQPLSNSTANQFVYPRTS
jgi:hypothetical protein